METDNEEIEFGQWWTAPAESENGQLIMVTGRSDISRFRTNPRFSIRIEITLPFDDPKPDGMPSDSTSELLGQITENFQTLLRKDPVAVLTGMFTGAGERNWVFYTLSTHIFQKKLNEALADLPLLPLEITAENDKDWEAYDEMVQAKVD